MAYDHYRQERIKTTIDGMTELKRDKDGKQQRIVKDFGAYIRLMMEQW